VFDDEQLLEKSTFIGELITLRLRALQQQFSAIGDVRGLGAMVAFELFDSAGKPDAALAQALVKRAAQQGLLLLSCGVYGNVIRILVPLTAAPALIDEGLAIIGECLATLS
jgi:4-aminobutyrate aminotransferase / (S)-3-amino-2-methylpropionate transaminase / 5-aminovalerate transaminase